MDVNGARITGRARGIVLSTFLFTAFAVLSPHATTAKNVTLAWDASTSPGVVGYRVYHGVASRNYTNQFSAGSATSGTLSNLVEGTTYYIAATAVNDLGVESEFSEELAYTIPTVQSPNQPPTLNALSDLTVNENADAQTVELTGITSGVPNEEQTLKVTASSSNPSLIPHPTVNYTSPNAVGQLVIQPEPFAFGTATITVTVDDGESVNNLVSRTFTVTVIDVNQPPTLNALSNLTLNQNAGVQTVDLTGITSGMTNEVQTLKVTATSSNPSLIPHPTVNYTSPNTVGQLTFQPVPLAFGVVTITVTVDDGGSANNLVSRAFTVAVIDVNQPPTLDQPDNLSVNQSAPAQTINLTGISSGAGNEVQTLVVSATSSNPDLIPHPVINYVSPNPTGQLTFQPVSNQAGSAIITVTVDDGGTSNNVVALAFTVTVTDSNVRPTLNSISNRTINENAGEQSVSLAGISSGSVNELQPLTVTATSSNPALIPNPTVNYTSPDTTGTLVFEPVTYAYGTATITVTVNDGGTANNTRSRSFTVTVRSVNQPPTLEPITDTVIAGGTEAIGSSMVVLSGITSGAPNENQTLTVRATSGSPALLPNPTVNYTSPNTEGTLALSPVPGKFGTATVTVTVNDGGASNNIVSQVFTVTIVPPNNPPTLDALANLSLSENSGPQQVNLSGITSGLADGVATVTVTAESSNPDLIPHPIVAYSSPDTVGSLSFTPATDVFGIAIITVTVNNGQAYNNSYSQSFAVSIDSDVAQLSLGATEVRAGQNGSVPVEFSSSEGVTSLNLVLEVPPGHLSDLSLQGLAPEIDPASASVMALPDSSVLIQFATRNGQILSGSKEIAQLSFAAAANQQSAFVPLRVRPFSATKADGSFIADRPAEPGRVVVVAQEALLEATFNADGSRRLMLFGKPASTYAIEYSTNPTVAESWVRLPSGVTLSTLSAAVPGIDAAAAQVFFRSVEIVAAP
ncbi:MAG: fibronectin type III domain-containing protein [Verrucomicrobiae bacterium]|nr:fibronectin type III domain-containing protein [Verrucomicrobiae bacterium]